MVWCGVIRAGALLGNSMCFCILSSLCLLFILGLMPLLVLQPVGDMLVLLLGYIISTASSIDL